MNRLSWVTSIPLGLCVVFSGLMYVACDDSYRSGTESSSSGNGTGGKGAGNSGSGGDIVLDLDGSVTCENVCSNDGREVRKNCNDEIVATCTADEGCLNGACVQDPCKAAEEGKSSLACDYWAVKTALRPQQDGACFAAFVANTWAKNVHLNVAYDGAALDPATFAYIPTVAAGGVVNYKPYDAVGGLPPGEVAILFLSRNPAGGGSVPDCPKPAAKSIETGFSGTGIGKAFHITTDYPVTAYQMVPFGGGTAAVTAATLLLPTSAWGTNYIAVNAYKAIPDPPPPANPIGGYPSLVVLAKEDATNVTIKPNVPIIGGPGVAAAMANTPITYKLNAGQFLQVTQKDELTGSPLESDKPVAVFGASTCMQVPTDKTDCDLGQQQLPPIAALDSEYVAVRYKSRNATEEPGVWRMVGVVDGTTLTWSPAKPPNAPTTLKLGEVAEFADPGPFVVRAQDGSHPFYLGAYMTGSQDFAGVGDPEWHNVIPPQQYLRRYVLFTDPTYPETSLVVVRVRSKLTKNFEPVTLKCLGELKDWTPLDKDYEWTRVNLVTGNFMNVGTCSNGPQEMSSDAPFGVTVWGWGTIQQTLRVSYAYPAGAGFKPINMIVVPPSK